MQRTFLPCCEVLTQFIPSLSTQLCLGFSLSWFSFIQPNIFLLYWLALRPLVDTGRTASGKNKELRGTIPVLVRKISLCKLGEWISLHFFAQVEFFGCGWPSHGPTIGLCTMECPQFHVARKCLMKPVFLSKCTMNKAAYTLLSS